MADQQPFVYASAPPTKEMASVGLSFPDLISYARQTVHFLQVNGESFIELAEIGFKTWSAISARDLTGVLAAFADGQRTVTTIIAAIKAEFGV